jgi:hypothetical protein
MPSGRDSEDSRVHVKLKGHNERLGYVSIPTYLCEGTKGTGR